MSDRFLIGGVPIALVAALVLSGCNGGGGGGGSSKNPPTSISFTIVPQSGSTLTSYFVESFAPFESFAQALRVGDQRYTYQQNNWWFNNAPSTVYSSYPLASSRVEYAHTVGLSGAGETIAIVDSGFLTSHEAFASNSVSTSGTVPVASHGTSVASVAAGSSGRMIGVAPGADLLLSSYNSMSSLASATNAATQAGAIVQNNSWGYVAPATVSGFNSVFGSTAGQQYLAALDNFSAQNVTVFTVSNDNSSGRADLMEALPSLRPSLERGWLAVANAVPVFNDERILSASLVSEPCGLSARWCLVADGAWNAASSSGSSSYGFVTGSSFAAPQVAGAMALLAEAFPDMTPHQLRTRLLATADNSFFAHDGQMDLLPGDEVFMHGYSNEFGHGFLDVRSALLPIGPPTAQFSDGTNVAVETLVHASGAAIGDAVQRSLQGVEVAIQDQMAGQFSLDASELFVSIAPESAGSQLHRDSLATDYAAQRMAPISGPDYVSPTFDSLMAFEFEDSLWSASLVAPEQSSSPDNLGFGLQTGFEFGAGGYLSLGAAVYNDDGALFGFTGLSGQSGANVRSLSLGVSQEWSTGTSLHMNAEYGSVDIDQPMIFANAVSANFNSFDIQLQQRDLFTRGDRLSLGMSLPAAISSGVGQMNVAIRSASGASLTQGFAVDLSPRDRQRDFSIGYNMPLSDNGEFAIRLVRSSNRGNIAGRRETAGVFGYQFRF